jgi:hypothetical protein
MYMKPRLAAVLPKLLLALLLAVPAVVTLPTPTTAASTGWIVTCQYAHSLADDPIVFPGQPGAAHLHDFVGALSADAFATAASLRAGGTSCAMPADTSAYWTPALYLDGVRVLPKNTAFYYRKKSPTGTLVQPFPEGLRMIVGNAQAQSPEDNPHLGSTIIFKCGPGVSVDLPAPPAQCSSGVLVISVLFPQCWDGVNLDSADHRSHMAYPVKGKCPASHPVELPRLETFFRYAVGTAPLGTLTLASGPYYTIHQDFFNGWEPTALQTLVTNCLNTEVDCGENPALDALPSPAPTPPTADGPAVFLPLVRRP